jgi:hypothetical protein
MEAIICQSQHHQPVVLQPKKVTLQCTIRSKETESVRPTFSVTLGQGEREPSRWLE